MINTSGGNTIDFLKKLFPDQAAVDAIKIPQPGQLDPITDKIISLIRDGRTYDGILADILTTYPTLDMTAIEQTIQKAIYINDLWGRLNA